jgi:four helix bundle protein
MTQLSNNYNLTNRTVQFSKSTIILVRGLKIDLISEPIAKQLLRSATSIGANYAEANGASSKKDFKNKIHICKKEAEETKYWLQLLLKCSDKNTAEVELLSREAHELLLIFQKIIFTMNRNELDKKI